MEESKIASKGKAKKAAVHKKKGSIVPEKAPVVNVISIYGLNLTLDNSLKKYANDKFIVEHTEMVNQRFARNKPKS